MLCGIKLERLRAAATLDGVDGRAPAELVQLVCASAEPQRVWSAGREFHAEAIIVATGASALWLGLESETRLRGRGVSACATCDGFFYRGQKVAVIGGGNTALEEALYLSNLAETVYLVHRRDKFRGEKILQNRVLEKDNIQVIWNSTLDEVLGEELPLVVFTTKILNLISREFPQKCDTLDLILARPQLRQSRKTIQNELISFVFRLSRYAKRRRQTG